MSEDKQNKKPVADASATPSKKNAVDPEDDRETLPADTPWKYLPLMQQKRDKAKPHKTMVQFPATPKKASMDEESAYREALRRARLDRLKKQRAALLKKQAEEAKTAEKEKIADDAPSTGAEAPKQDELVEELKVLRDRVFSKQIVPKEDPQPQENPPPEVASAPEETLSAEESLPEEAAAPENASPEETLPSEVEIPIDEGGMQAEETKPAPDPLAETPSGTIEKATVLENARAATEAKQQEELPENDVQPEPAETTAVNPEVRILKAAVKGLVAAVIVLFSLLVVLGWMLLSERRSTRPAPSAFPQRIAGAVPGQPTGRAAFANPASPAAPPAGTPVRNPTIPADEGEGSAALEGKEATEPQPAETAAEEQPDTDEQQLASSMERLQALFAIIAGVEGGDDPSKGQFQNLDQLVRGLASTPKETLAAAGLEEVRLSVSSLPSDKPLPHDVLWRVTRSVLDVTQKELDRLREIGEKLPKSEGTREYRKHKKWIAAWLLGNTGAYCQIRERFWEQSRGGDPSITEEVKENAYLLQKERDQAASVFRTSRAPLYDFCDRKLFEKPRQ